MAYRLTREQIAELRQLEREATPGKLTLHEVPWVSAWAADERGGEVLVASPERRRDVHLAVAVRNALSDLLDDLEQARRERDELLSAAKAVLPLILRDGNIAGHGHDVPGIWDVSNGPPKGGQPCQECAAAQALELAVQKAEASNRSNS